MNSFTADWLALREPTDKISRNALVLAACENAFRRFHHISVCDAGAGTGASVRAFSNFLPKKQTWTLVDADLANLHKSLALLSARGDVISKSETECSVRLNEKIISTRILKRDLSETSEVWPDETQLITASAVFDLVSTPWVSEFIKILRRRNTSLLATLTFNGKMNAEPHHDLDEAMFNAFRAHQRTDKGFGAAAGPDAVSLLRDGLIEAGFTVAEGESPWILGNDNRALMEETLKGIAFAAMEIGHVEKRDADAWLNDRLRGTQQFIVGHTDIFAERTL